MGRARARTSAGLALDGGALIALELIRGLAFRVPAGVVGKVWRDGLVQATLAGFLRSDEVEIVSLDGQLARACGELCGATKTRDVIDASVVMLARERRDPIVTSDPADLLRLDAGAEIIAV